MALKEMWKKYLELENEGIKLYDESDKLWSKGNKSKSWKLSDEANELWNKADKLIDDFIKENYGEGAVTINDDKITLFSGIILYYDGRVYEPLEIVMKKIIKEHEESKK